MIVSEPGVNGLVVPPGPCAICGSPPCTWGDDAWHRAVKRLTALPVVEYHFRVLLAEERAKTGGEQP